MSRPLRVFISHTSELPRLPGKFSFVQAAIDAVNAGTNAPVDMRFFTASDLPAAELCEARVKECDVYVGIVGVLRSHAEGVGTGQR